MDERTAWLTASSFLPDILCCLAKHFGRPVMLLVDEYDVPLEKAASSGYYEKMRLWRAVFLFLKRPFSPAACPSVRKTSFRASIMPIRS